MERLRGQRDRGSFGTVGDLLILFSFSKLVHISCIFKESTEEDSLQLRPLLGDVFLPFIYATLALPLLGCDISVIWSFTHRTWTAVAFLGAGASAAAYFCWFHGLSVLPVSRIVAFQFLQPFAGAMIAFLLLENGSLYGFSPEG